MGLATLTRRLTRRRVQLTFFSGLALSCLLAVGFLATQVFLKLDDYTTASQDNVPWSLSRLEVEQLKMLSALHEIGPNDPEAMQLVHRRFDALYSRRGTIAVGSAYHPILEQREANEALSALSAHIAAMETIIDSGDDQILAQRRELLRLTEELSPAIRTLAALGITTDAKQEEAERKALTSKLIQVTALSIMLLVALISLAVLLWQLYRLYRHRALENRQTMTRLTTILDTSQDAVLVVCPDGCIIDTNRAADAMFFGDDTQADRPPISKVLLRKQPDGSLSEVSGEKLLMSCQDGPNLCANLMARAPSGDIFPVELSADTAQRSGQRVVVCFIRNIARRMADQAALLAARDRALSGEKAKARFLGMISHEMRTPLTGMLGALDLLDDTAMSPKQKTYAQIMQSSGQMLLNQINDALDVAQADQGTLALSEEVFNLDALVDTLLRTQRPMARKVGNTLRLTTPPDTLGQVRGDRDRVHQVLLNLVSNAIKFTRDGEITVDVARLDGSTAQGDMVEMQVADTGIGIAEEDQARIFEDFVRLEANNGPSVEGTGLGLGIVRNLVVLMGGEIGVESEPGEGSLFWVRLPLPAADNVAAFEQPSDPAQMIGPQTVLIVEDNEINRTVLAEMLRKDGHEVWTATDGADGVAQADARPFDVILMDINMPVLDGFAATRQIRAGDGASKSARIIALSAQVASDAEPQSLEAGMDGMLTKPLRREDLERVLSGRAPKHPTPTGVAMVDEAVLGQLQSGLGQDVLVTLVDGFEAQGTSLIADLPTLSGEHLVNRLHELAGLAATLGARALHAALSTAEQALKAEDTTLAQTTLDGLPALWATTLDQISTLKHAA